MRLLALMGMLVIRGSGAAGGHLLMVRMGLTRGGQGGGEAEHQAQQAELAKAEQSRRQRRTARPYRGWQNEPVTTET